MELKRRLFMGGLDQSLDPLIGRLFDGLVDAVLLGVSGHLHERQSSRFIARGQRPLSANSADGVLESRWSWGISNAVSG
jgi:hypothetical protein